MTRKKPVVFEGKEIGKATTLVEAATLARSVGVNVNPNNYRSIAQHVGEDRLIFNVIRGQSVVI